MMMCDERKKHTIDIKKRMQNTPYYVSFRTIQLCSWVRVHVCMVNTCYVSELVCTMCQHPSYVGKMVFSQVWVGDLHLFLQLVFGRSFL